MMKASLALSLALLTLTSFAQVRTAEDYWSATQLKFEQVIYGDINDVSCKKTLKTFLGCLDAVNTALNLVHPDKVFFLLPDPNSSSPLLGFGGQVLDIKTPNLRDIFTSYLSDVAKFYQNTMVVPTSFGRATAVLNEEVKNTGKESYYTALIYNTYLKDSYDPHTYIMPIAYMESLSSPTSTNKIYGIRYGKLKYRGEDKLLLLSVQSASSSEKAGLEAGDIILSVNDKTTPEQMNAELNKDQVDMMVEGSSGLRSIHVARAEVSVPNVVANLVHDERRSFGYIKLSSFTDKTACYTIAKYGFQFMAQKVDGIILDLRGNGGGLVAMAQCVMGMYLEEGSLTWLQKNLDNEQVLASKVTTDRRIFKDIHTVTLIDGMSASASEALSMYLQAYRKSYIVGERSFGKGTMQMTSQWDKNSAVLSAKTVAKYYGPQGISPQIQGVKPDFEVLPYVTQKDPTPFSREEDLYSNAIVNKSKEVPLMEDRKKEISDIKGCLDEKKQVLREYGALDEFKQRVFDQQLSSAKAVIDCAYDLDIPVFSGLDIPTVDSLD